MKKIHTLILIFGFLFFSCSGDDKTDEITEIPQGITVKINGITKVFKEVSVSQYVHEQGTPSEYTNLILLGKIEKNSKERISFAIPKKGEISKNAVNQVLYIDGNEDEYYYYPGTNLNFSVELIENSFENVLKGEFSGTLYQNQGGNELYFKKGSFNIQY